MKEWRVALRKEIPLDLYFLNQPHYFPVLCMQALELAQASLLLSVQSSWWKFSEFLTFPQFSALSGAPACEYSIHAECFEPAQCFVVFFGTHDSLDILLALRLTMQIDVCSMDSQPLDCRAVHRRLAVYPMALQPLNCRAFQCWVAEVPPETAHPIFAQYNRSLIYCCDDCSYCCDVAISSSSDTRDNR